MNKIRTLILNNKYLTEQLKELCNKFNVPFKNTKKKMVSNRKSIENYNINITLNNNYPFEPPNNITINNNQVNCINNINTVSLLKKYFDLYCIKCQSLLCPNNWNPTIKLVNIIKEQIKYYKYINSINNICIIQNNIYLNDDILFYIMSFIKE